MFQNAQYREMKLLIIQGLPIMGKAGVGYEFAETGTRFTAEHYALRRAYFEQVKREKQSFDADSQSQML